MGVTGQPANDLSLSDLERGLRVKHLDYGVGTVDLATGYFVYITWDDPKVPYRHHDKAIVQYLTRE